MKKNLIPKKSTKGNQIQQKFKLMKLLNPFGPQIAILKLPKILINKINKEVENTLRNKVKLKKLDYSKKLVGQVNQEIELTKTFINKHISKFIQKSINDFLKKSIKKKSKHVKIKNFWIVRQFKNEYNPIHYHNGDISGVGYLKIPNKLTKGKKKIKTNGTIDFVNGTKSFLSNSIFNHTPKVGDLILFPHYLMHAAYPFIGDGERRSFSFNIKLDENISNVFND